MPNQQPKSSVAWRCRREEYLRASERYDDLIKEGYMAAAPRSSWSVIAGGHTNRHQKEIRNVSLSLVKGLAS